MNKTLELAYETASKLPDMDQERIGEALFQLLEEREVDAKLAASETRGGFTPLAEACEVMRGKTKKEHGL